MNRLKTVALVATHGIALAVGFAGGIYFLPILTEPPGPESSAVAEVAATRDFMATFSRDREDSDALHWGEGEVSIRADAIAFTGELAPGPDYRLYLSPEFVETEADFNRLKPGMVEIGAVRTFSGFLLPVPDHVDPSDYRAVIVWCESFGEFITSGEYRAPADSSRSS